MQTVRNGSHESEKVLKLISTRVTVVTEEKTKWRKKRKKEREREEKKRPGARKGTLNNTQSMSKEGSYRR